MIERIIDKKEIKAKIEMSGKRILYRPHRGGLREAMAESRAFDTLEEMENHIAETIRQ